jgi:hypothetical protein
VGAPLLLVAPGEGVAGAGAAAPLLLVVVEGVGAVLLHVVVVGEARS